MGGSSAPPAASSAIGVAVAIGAAAVLGCAAKQSVPLDCVPEQVTVYVDGRALEGSPKTLELRSDEPHKLYFKGPGYEPRMLILEPAPGADGRQKLHPSRVCVELVPVGMDRDLQLQVEED
jgi:hypothetical protein